MNRLVTPPKRVTSPSWGPPTPCKQALKIHDYIPSSIEVIKYLEYTSYSYRWVPASKDFTCTRALFNLFRNVMNYSNLLKIDWT